MPLEIRELIIKVNITEHGKSDGLESVERQFLDMKGEIITECIEKVMAKIETNLER